MHQRSNEVDVPRSVAQNPRRAQKRPGHTFVLVNAAGEIAWIRDYGAPQNGGLMYVPVEELTEQIQASLNR